MLGCEVDRLENLRPEYPYYQAEGSRLLVNARTEEGGCTPSGWRPEVAY